VGGDDVAYLVLADAPGFSDPVDLQFGVSGRDVGIKATAAGGHGVGRYLRIGGRRAADRHQLAEGVVLARLRAFDPDAFVAGQERRGGGVARFVDADDPGRVGDLARRVAGSDHREHRADTTARAERARAVGPIKLPDVGAARAYLGEQARLVR
jgi:hypothetical protein